MDYFLRCYSYADVNAASMVQNSPLNSIPIVQNKLKYYFPDRFNKYLTSTDIFDVYHLLKPYYPSLWANIDNIVQNKESIAQIKLSNDESGDLELVYKLKTNGLYKNENKTNRFRGYRLGEDQSIKEDLLGYRSEISYDESIISAFYIEKSNKIFVRCESYVEILNENMKLIKRYQLTGLKILICNVDNTGEILLIAYSNNKVEIYNIFSGECIQELESQKGIISAIFSNDSKYILTIAKNDKNIKIWDLYSGKHMQTLKESTLNNKLNFITLAVYSHDSKYILTACNDKTPRPATFWDATTCTPVYNLNGNTSSITTAEFSHDAKYILTGSVDYIARLWDATNGTCITTLQSLQSLMFNSLAGSDLKHNSSSKNIDSNYNSPIKTDSKFAGSPTKNLKSIKDKNWESTTYNNDKNWDTASVASKITTGTLGTNGGFKKYSLGSLVSVSLKSAIKSAIVKSVIKVTNIYAKFSHDSKCILTLSGDSSVNVYNTSTGECINTLYGHYSKVTTAVFSHDSKKILSGSDDYSLRIWDITSGQCIQVINGHSDSITSAVFSQDSKQILSGSSDKTIRVWDVVINETLKGHTSKITIANFSHDSKYILTGSTDKIVRVYDSNNYSCIHVLEGHTSKITSAVYSYDNKYILTNGYFDRTARVWDALSGKNIHALTGHKNEINSALFSHDSKYILTGSNDRTVGIWDVVSGDCIQTLQGHKKGINSALYSHDDKKILTGSSDSTACVWDSYTGNCCQTLIGHTGKIKSAVFINNSDSKLILTLSTDLTGMVWESESGVNILILSNSIQAVLSSDIDKMQIITFSNDFLLKVYDIGNLNNIKETEGIKLDKDIKIYKVSNSMIYSNHGIYSQHTGVLLYSVPNNYAIDYYSMLYIHEDIKNQLKISNEKFIE